MKFTQIRNATVQIEYAGQRFLVDPLLAAKEAYPGFAGTLNSQQRWPLVDLPFSLEQVLAVDAVIVTHTHADHWDALASEIIPKDMPLFVQHQADRQLIEAAGFRRVSMMGQASRFADITLTLTSGQHGLDKTVAALKERLGQVSGVVFRHPDEPTVYLAGDTIWTSEVAQNIATYQPDVLILNAGDAQIPGFGSIIMGKQDLLRAHQAAPQATIIATHLEAVNHAALSRAELAQFIAQQQLSKWVKIPADGESYSLK